MHWHFHCFQRKKMRQQELMTYYAYCTIRQKERLLLRYQKLFLSVFGYKMSYTSPIGIVWDQIRTNSQLKLRYDTKQDPCLAVLWIIFKIKLTMICAPFATRPWIFLPSVIAIILYVTDVQQECVFFVNTCIVPYVELT